MSTDELLVVMDGRVVGNILVRGKRSRLLYDQAAVSTPLSLSMPISGRRYPSSALAPWVRGLLPDREEVLRRWRRVFGVRSLDPVDLLLHVGEEVAGGAQFITDERLTEAMRWTPAVTISEQEMGDMLRRAMAHMPEAVPGLASGRFSLAGMQPKIALQKSGPDSWALPSGINPTTHLIKPAIPGLQDQHINEHLTMSVAAEAGLPTARTEPALIDGIPVVVVERYDRFERDGRWNRIHQEDLLQAMGLYPSRKYESDGGPGARDIASFMRAHGLSEESVRRFAQSIVFHWLTASTDAHAKNYSVLLAGSRATLAPLYDLNSFLAYGDPPTLTMSIKVGGEDRVARVGRAEWELFAEDCSLPPEWVVSEIDRQSAIIPGAYRRAADDLAPRPGFDTPLPARLSENAAAWVEWARRHVGLSSAGSSSHRL